MGCKTGRSQSSFDAKTCIYTTFILLSSTLIKNTGHASPCMQECPLSQQFIKLKENMAVYYVGGLSKAHAFNHVMRSVRFYYTEFIILLKTINSIFICSKPPGLFWLRHSFWHENGTILVIYMSERFVKRLPKKSGLEQKEVKSQTCGTYRRFYEMHMQARLWPSKLGVDTSIGWA